MKIAIHYREGSFSDRWIEYCKNNKIEYLLVNCHRSDIINYLRENKVTHLMWHINHSSDIDLRTYAYVLNSADQMGVKTFPNFNTRWHFDDKIAQMYLLQSLNQPVVSSFVYYNEKDALNSLSSTDFPIVAKLRRGAGATNVKLLKNRKEASEYIRTMFSKGYNPHSSIIGNYKQKLNIARSAGGIKNIFIKGIRYLKNHVFSNKSLGNERGYFYFQEFLPNNDYDTRVVVVGNKAVAIRRGNRKNDFRASGSGNISYDVSLIDIKMIEIAFELRAKMNFQSLAFDFVYEANREPKIIEICFGFAMKAYDLCEGYWDANLNFYKQKVNLQEEMIRDFLNENVF
ncbi:ATP-grasp domain-containing protein [Riemerella anatipestifer]|nr:hypothetical protein [Riemerella anatipestifer]MCO7355845.1 hypothetical protein [Riemerella anatipestifer]MCU7581760.1 hypothetical protein [Riemerella anatipestifer]MCW0518354.1 hypothetical protein [Riemerella anatipestifer]MDR7750431.1 hypothetical protein [Riemerella anatipestifer]MDR7752665.1 hypothetical protein [Riemerella anatipestifer]